MTQAPSKISPELKQRYASNLAARKAEIEALITARPTPGRDAAATMSQLQAMVHRLAGTGATFGFPEVSAAARNLDRVLANPSKPAEEIVKRTGLLLAALKAAASGA